MALATKAMVSLDLRIRDCLETKWIYLSNQHSDDILPLVSLGVKLDDCPTQEEGTTDCSLRPGTHKICQSPSSHLWASGQMVPLVPHQYLVCYATYQHSK